MGIPIQKELGQQRGKDDTIIMKQKNGTTNNNNNNTEEEGSSSVSLDRQQQHVLLQQQDEYRQVVLQRYGTYNNQAHVIQLPTMLQAVGARLSSPLVVVQVFGQLLSVLEEGAMPAVFICAKHSPIITSIQERLL